MQHRRQDQHAGLPGAAAPDAMRRRWRASPGVFPGAEPAGAAHPPASAAPDLLGIMLRADARHARREAWLGVLLALAVTGLLLQGWLLPLLAFAFLAAPVAGTLLAWRRPPG